MSNALNEGVNNWESNDEITVLTGYKLGASIVLAAT